MFNLWLRHAILVIVMNLALLLGYFLVAVWLRISRWAQLQRGNKG